LIVRAKTTALAGVILLVAGVATACTFACVHEVGDFKNGRADSAAIDSGFDDSVDAPIEEDVDSLVPDLGKETIVIDSDGASDTGPPDPVVSCTAVGPASTICIETASLNLGAANAFVCPAAGCAPELPEVSVKVSRLFVDEHEVSVGRFRAWWGTMPRPWPAAGAVIFQSAAKDLRWRNTWPTAPTEPPMIGGCFWKGGTDSSNDDKPLNCVDWYTALAFCMHEGKRLLTEAEWELVATAGEERLFPWSAAATEEDEVTSGSVTCAHALTGTCTPATANRDSTAWGRTKNGVWNMAGSLAEWTLDGPLTDYTTVIAGTVDPVTDPSTSTLRTIRGGSYVTTDHSKLRAAYRTGSGVNATTPDAQIGFRCAKRAI